MTPFVKGFGDELEKLSIVSAVAKGGAKAGKFLLKHPWKALGALFIGGAAVEGARKARQARSAPKNIRPSRAYYTNFHRALGVPRGQMTELRKRRLFAHARAVPGRYKQ